MSNEQDIGAWLANRKYTVAGIAGVLGNLAIESGFRPTAYNAKENAIGIAQWEGGRKTSLDALAKQMNKPDTDLQVQLAWMGQELDNPQYASLNHLLQTTTDPAAAANAWNSTFERSADTSNDRVNAANVIYKNLSTGTSIPIPGINVPITAGLGPVKDAASGVLSGMDAVGAFFNKLGWIFSVDHFMRFLLYVFGGIAVIGGLGMITFGSKVGGDE